MKFRPIAALVLCAALLLTACLKLPPATAQSRYGDLNKEFPGNLQAQALALAAEHGDVKEIRRLMKDEGVNPDTVFAKDGLPLVAWPIFTKNPAGLKAMLENGQDSTIVEMYAGLGGFMQTHWLLEQGAIPTKHTVEAIFWRPTKLKDPVWQRRCQQWLLQRDYKRPPMPKGMHKLREAFGFPTNEKDIPLL